MPKAVIFDFDGVIVDTERLYPDLWHGAAARRGRTFPDAVINATAGKPNRRIVAELFPDLSAPDQEVVLTEIAAGFRGKLATQLRTLPGVTEFLAWLRPRARIALATNSSTGYVADLTGRTGLTGMFDPVVCGDGKFRPKPEPDIYLRVLELLGLPAGECLVFEDSPVGLTAARRAGLRAVGVVGTFAAHDLREHADALITDWAEARALAE